MEKIIDFETPEILHSERSLEVELRTSLSPESRIKRTSHWRDEGMNGAISGSASPRFWGLERFQVVMQCVSNRPDCSVDVPQGFVPATRRKNGCGPNGDDSEIDRAMSSTYTRLHAKNAFYNHYGYLSLPVSGVTYQYGTPEHWHSGNVQVANASGFGATVPQHYIYGGTDDSVTIYNSHTPWHFTMCSLSRYTGDAKRSIIGVPSMYDPMLQTLSLSHGHHEGHRGVAFYETWQTNQSDVPGGSDLDWLVMCGKNNLPHWDPAVQSVSEANILADGLPRQLASAPAWTGSGHYNPLMINPANFYGPGFSGSENSPSSDWAVGHLMVWDRHLSDQEMAAVSETMMRSLHDDDIDLANCAMPLPYIFEF